MDLCATCLCSDRNLNYLWEESLVDVYKKILNETQLYEELDSSICPRVCCQCQWMLKKFHKFKLLVHDSYHKLHNYESNAEIVRMPQLQTVLNVIHWSQINVPTNSYNDDVKTDAPEVDMLDIKTEKTEEATDTNVSQNMTHLPSSASSVYKHDEGLGHTEETFVNGIDLPELTQEKVSKKRKVKKKVKEKIKKPAKSNPTIKKPSKSNPTKSNNDDNKDNVAVQKKVKEKFKKTSKIKENDESNSINSSKYVNNDDAENNDYLDNNDDVNDNDVDDPEWAAEELQQKETEKENQEDIDSDEDNNEENHVNITEENSASIIKHIILSPEELAKERQEMMGSADYIECSFKCMSCVVMFKNKGLMKKHEDDNHILSIGPHICSTCESRFRSPAALAAHLPIHTSRHVCTVCGLREYDEAQMLRHAKEHAQYKCNVCGHTSKSASSHQSHLSSAHDRKPFCVECDKTFNSRKTYRYHVNVMHKGKNRFPCKICGKVYMWKSNLWRHIKNHKAIESGELYCIPCDKKFSSVETYRNHVRTARSHVPNDQFKFVCTQCGERFVSKIKLKDHVDWEHLQKMKYRCNFCEKPYKSHTSLYVHMQNLHRNPYEKDNLCHICGKSYHSNAKLRYHITAMHTAETPYKCKECPAAFSWYSSLYRHVRDVHLRVKRPKRVRKTKKIDGAPEEARGPMVPPVVGPAPPTLREML